MTGETVFHPAPNRPQYTQNSVANTAPGNCADIADASGRSENAKRLFCDLRSIGVVLSIDGDGRLSFDGPDDVLTDARLSVMRAHRDRLLALVELFEQRAAIAEYDGGLSRPEAERLALGELLCHDNQPGKKQNNAPELVEMPEGVRCPFCPGRSMIDDPGGCRCAGCGRLAWVTFPGGGICRADFVGVEL